MKRCHICGNRMQKGPYWIDCKQNAFCSRDCYLDHLEYCLMTLGAHFEAEKLNAKIDELGECD